MLKEYEYSTGRVVNLVPLLIRVPHPRSSSSRPRQTDRFIMIRSNPTAIPLRASDLKHLQATIEERQKAADAAANPAAAGATSNASAAQEERGQSSGTAQPQSAAEKRKKDRAAMSVNERIGL